MALARRFEGREVGLEVLEFGSRICPIFPARLPKWAQTLIVRNRVLDNDAADALRMGQRQTKTNGASVVLHEQDVVCDSKPCRKFIRHLRKIVESVLEVGWRGRAAVAESGIIRRDEMIFVGE